MRISRITFALMSLVVVIATTGCGSSIEETAQSPDKDKPAKTMPSVTAPVEGYVPPKVTEQPVANPLPQSTPQDDSDLVKAEVGLGEKGHYDAQNMYTVAVSARFRAEERLLLGQIDQGIKIFKATEGRNPKSHEEFMEKVINANGYRLPELPEGQSYYYDPERGPDGELMVRMPKK